MRQVLCVHATKETMKKKKKEKEEAKRWIREKKENLAKQVFACFTRGKNKNTKKKKETTRRVSLIRLRQQEHVDQIHIMITRTSSS